MTRKGQVRAFLVMAAGTAQKSKPDIFPWCR